MSNFTRKVARAGVRAKKSEDRVGYRDGEHVTGWCMTLPSEGACKSGAWRDSMKAFYEQAAALRALVLSEKEFELRGRTA